MWGVDGLEHGLGLCTYGAGAGWAEEFGVEGAEAWAGLAGARGVGCQCGVRLTGL